MKVDGKNRFAYNAQALVDQQAGIIMACEATRQETDVEQLVPMIEQAQENIGIAAQHTLTVADTGYGAGADLQAASEKGLNVLAPPMEGSSTADQPYATRYFHYDARERTVTCPQGKKLDHEWHTTKKGQRIERYRCHWRDCPVRAQCTRDPKGRQLEVRPWTALVQAMRERLKEPPARALWSQRGEIIERIFAQIKEHEGFRRWTVWGLDAVKTQWAMLCATLNLRALYKSWRTKTGTRPVGAEMAAWLGRQRKKWFFTPGTAIQHEAMNLVITSVRSIFVAPNSNQPAPAKNF
jgi:Transposase DDE domain